MLFDTGLRATELCSLRTDDVNWDNQTIVVRETKGDNQRVVSVGTSATRALMSYVRVRGKPSPWLFASLDGQRLTINALKLRRVRAERDCPALHLKDFTPKWWFPRSPFLERGLGLCNKLRSIM